MSSIAPPAHTRTAKTTDSWITPKWLLERLGPFDLDPCAAIPQPWPCAAHQYTMLDNGLLLPWEGFVYMNPPYGLRINAWLNRLALHNNGIALIFARTETASFFTEVWPVAKCLLFLRGRLTFHYPDGSLPIIGHNSGGPSVLVAYGAEAEKRLMKNRDLGALVSIWPE